MSVQMRGILTVSRRGCRGASSLRGGCSIVLALLCLVLAILAPQPVEAQLSCSTMPMGLFLQRWNELDGRFGPLGCPTGPEVSVAGTKIRSMPFEHGEVV